MLALWRHYRNQTLKLISKKKLYKTDTVPSHMEQLGPLEMRFCSNPKCQNNFCYGQRAEKRHRHQKTKRKWNLEKDDGRTLTNLRISKGVLKSLWFFFSKSCFEKFIHNLLDVVLMRCPTESTDNHGIYVLYF